MKLTPRSQKKMELKKKVVIQEERELIKDAHESDGEEEHEEMDIQEAMVQEYLRECEEEEEARKKAAAKK